jgi:flagellar basal-body rod protein FlgB
MYNMDDLTSNLLKISLTAAAKRTNVIAHNIANAETAGFKASSVEFEDNLKRALKSQAATLTTTSDKHIDSILSQDLIKVKTDTSTSMNEDGNNVDVDLQMTNLAANFILYSTLISQINSRLSMTNYVITGGSK